MGDDRSISVELKIMNELGLHARPAAMLVQAVSKLNASVNIAKEDLVVDGKSIMGVLTLAAEQGSRITITSTGPEAQKAVDAIRELVEDGFGED